jgi:GNAT superfamily N-acetyltransferase
VLPAGLTHTLDVVRDLGLRRTVRVASRWLLEREFHIVAGTVDVDLDVAAPPGARCAVLREDDLPAFARGCPGMSGGEVRRRWREQQVCLVCWIGTEVAAYRWDAADAAYLPYLGRRVRGAPGDVLTVEARTLPGRRRAGAGSALVQARLRLARSHGARRLVGLVATWNRASLAWAAAVGWIPMGVVGYRRAGWRRRYFVEGALRLEGDEVVLLPEAEPARPAPRRARGERADDGGGRGIRARGP